MMNDLDVAKLIVAFGNQRVEFSFQSAPLGAWLSSELSSDEMATVNKILSDKKLNINFNHDARRTTSQRKKEEKRNRNYRSR